MPLPRLLFIIISLSIILGLIIWLVDSVYRLYIQISFTAPLLGNLLIFLIIGLLSFLIYALIYYFNLALSSKFSSTRRHKRYRPKLPEQKTEAAQKTLKAVRRQVKQIQDEVSKKALLIRSRQIETSLAKGNLQVVVFGTGSAGKTSLVNALIGEIVGNVEATFGTTKIGETYSLQLPKVPRNILITDTPGILEIGVKGTEREQLARKLATEANLLLFVTDNDLRQSEYELLQTLVNIGKRSLLILNKIDLYPKEELTLIMEQLQRRVRGLISPLDVIPVAAKPQSFLLKTNEIITPEPEIIPLINRLAVVLRAEGEDLIADNILLQSQRLGEEARKIIDRQRRQQADKIIDRYRWIGAGVISVTPLPVVDMLAMAAVNTQMVIEIGQIYGCKLNSGRAKELALSLGKTLISLGIVKGALELLSQALQLNIATYLVGRAIQGVTAAYLTRIAGNSFIEYFRHDQDWGDGGITEVVQHQFELSRKDKFIKRFVSDAIAKVVEPLTANWEGDEKEFTPVSREQETFLEEDEW